MTLPGLSYGVPDEQRSTNASSAGEVTRSSYDHGQSTIPGLAFGQSDLGSGSYTNTPSRQLKQSSFQAPQASESHHPTPRDVPEEGEISDDEEDLYEPEEPDTQIAVDPVSNSLDRERTGSYSPYLSPREVDESQFDHYNTGLGNTESLLETSVSEAKKQAQEAILRLSLLKVQYKDFVNDGIDATVLGNLFKELGMNYTEHTQKLAAAPPTRQQPVQEVAKIQEMETVQPIAPKSKDEAPAPAPTPPKDAPKESRDAAESRKDRIARLLAARKGKTPEPAPIAAKPVQSPAPTKASLEKSKLLHQKMQALLKSREALQRERAQAVETAEPQLDADAATQDLTAIVADQFPMHQAIPTAPRAMLAQSKPQVQAPFDRALHQSRSSRLLIDVSDEEGEDEMDIDSQDEQGEISHATPQSGSATESDELNNMKMKIEAMKQRIAEAEARKKARQSIPGSPTAPNLHLSSVEAPMVSAISEGLSSEVTPAETVQRPLTTHEAATSSFELRSVSRDRSVARSSRAASERLSAVEAHRKDQLLKLKALQSQIANIQKNIDDSLLEEQKLQEESMEPEEEDEEEQVQSDYAQGAADEDGFTETLEPANTSALSAALEREQHDFVEQGKAVRSDAHVQEESVAEPEIESNVVQLAQDDTSETSSDGDESGLPDASDASDDEDVPMDEADDDSEDESPPIAPHVATEGSSEDVNSDSEAEIEIHDGQTKPTAHDVEPAEDDNQAAEGQPSATVKKAALPTAPRSSFVPYDSPLHYFHSYRFHPDYNQEVLGGLRSLTYSNKIDTAQPICPDELSGRQCPRGVDCEFQHFNSMQAADDQILLQLGAHGSLDESQKQQYISGLRQLLTDFRDRKIKDFDTISKGIVEYRAQFTGDKSKILPLGDVSI